MQNKYDDPAFFANYSQMARSIGGLRESTSDPAIEYRRLAIEDIDFAAGEFDVVLSSPALHYVKLFDTVCHKVHHCLVAGGSFVLLQE